ncbi:hypothetical protein EZS27_023211 [termite gut metagenome]|uniref:Type III restriction enzyme C-terminal endonuclease domain-containing protein n=1 Tax=termite gut metagenome TaxID=433724 RepID=A0A5J4R2A8_9ZZZZ
MRRIQIRETIVSHLEKERELYKKGIKVLSLFFIDEVAKYKFYDDTGEQKGDYAKIFEEEYAEQLRIKNEKLRFAEEADYRAYLEQFSTENVHAGYFSIDKKGHVVDSEVKRGESESADISAYDLIMKNKERLLSHDEPVRFIFSHSALREGWDNPNVFQICTLRQSSAKIKKRQEIGRGLRLCVNKDGDRMDAEILGKHAVHDVNVLTVIANESYDEFARALQDEFAEVIKNRPREITPDLFTGKTLVDNANNEHTITSTEASRLFVKLEDNGLIKDGQLTDSYHSLSDNQKLEKIKEQLSDELKPFAENIQTIVANVYDPKRNPLVSNGRKNDKLNLDREKFASKTFQELWAKINAKTYYTVQFDEDKLIEACIRSLNKNLMVTQTKVVVTEGYLKETGQDKKPEMQKLKGKEIILQEIANKNVKYDLLKELSTPTRLTRKTITTILTGIERGIFDKFKQNPEEFIRNAIKLIDEQKAGTIIEHITYNLANDNWKAEEIFVDASISGEYGKNMIDAKKHLYDKLRYDSAIEKQLSEEMDIQEVVEMYVKLPSGFYIHTPMGKYNPDWAISLKEGDVKHIYFVAETKGDISELSLREVEHAKIECARKHFAKISNKTVKYDVVDSFETLLKKIRGNG